MTNRKNISGFDERYTVDVAGIVYKNNKALSCKRIDKYGYIRMILTHNKKKLNFLAHRLVAIAFIPNPENKPQVNHINGIKSDNRVENLEWATNKENIIHSFGIGRVAPNGSSLYNSKLIESDIPVIKKLLTENNTLQSVADKYKLSVSTVSRIRDGKKWKHVK